ncbi:MAG: YbaK/EbsC family protein [Desulfuromonadaceae bacterium]|nr:YbaK/EbsC family protein [Desulfuromonadaceae bacterium]
MPNIEDIKEFLAARDIEVWEFSDPTPTSIDAARTVGCGVAEIAKTILMIVNGSPVTVVTCGDMKVNTSKLKKRTGMTGKARLPGQEEVLQFSGYRPGGVCPFLLPPELPVLLDSSLRRFRKVYAAAGNDHSAVPITFDQLLELTGGQEADVCMPLAEY